MATLVLSAAGNALGGPVGAAIGGAIGSAIDSYVIGTFMPTQKQEGPRLDNLRVQSSTEGAALLEVAGGVRIPGQIIWATSLKEVAKTEKQGGKGGGGGVETTTYSYFANFAVGLCEGVIDGIGKIWADGKLLDQNGFTMRLYRGTDDQAPDSLIEGVEGVGKAPAYRGTAYVVVDNLPLSDFGNRLPQLTFEVYRQVGGPQALEKMVTAVAMIPGAGERVLDPVIQTRYAGVTSTIPENRHTRKPQADWLVAMDDAEATLPNLGTVLLVVGWFGDDLRAGECKIRPRVEFAEKVTTPDLWRVHGIDRGDAPLVSYVNGKPAYGGTPSDDSVVRAIRDLKARGLQVVLYPFIFMDVPAGNTKPSPYGGASQPPHPWRGRITCHPAPGQSGTVDKTATAATQVSAFFGTATASAISFSVAASGAVSTSYSGPSEWSFRRFILHYAKLAAAINAVDPGAVDAFLVGSELRALMQVRSSATAFPAVAAMVTLAADVKAVVGSGVKVSYAADWSEYNGYKPNDGSGDYFHHLDPIWASSSVDFVGVDNYIPLSDWRNGRSHLDAVDGWRTIYDPFYLASNVEGGELYDWFYATENDRKTQLRTPITDGAHGEPWMHRAKDFRNWWLNVHHNRIAGVRQASPTGWAPQSKPIWFTEWGVPSVDRGTNQPNVFYDPKSSESFFPHFSRGRRDDLIQRRGLEALLTYWADDANNPVSTVYSGRMIGMTAVWCWDARPFPAWPSRKDVWADGPLWPLGHWIKGKIGFSDLAALTAERCRRVGFLAYDVSRLIGIVPGYVRDRPLSPRAEIEMLMAAYAFDAVESGGVIRFQHRGEPVSLSLDLDDLVAADGDDEALALTRGEDVGLPDEVTVTFTDMLKDYQSGSVSARRIAGYSERVVTTQVALTMDDAQAKQIAERTLAESWIMRDSAHFALPPSLLAVEPCDVVDLVVEGRGRSHRIQRVSDTWSRRMEAVREQGELYGPVLPGPPPPPVDPEPIYGPAVLRFLDLPLLTDDAVPHAPWVAAAATPWAGVMVLDSPTGADFSLDTSLPVQAVMGETRFDFYAGPLWRWDRVNSLYVRIYSGELASTSEAAVLPGANALAVQAPDGDWEIVQFATAVLEGPGDYKLQGLLRGQLGTEGAMRSPLAAGAPVVLLNGAVDQLEVQSSERGVERFYRWGPSRLPVTDPAWRAATFTARGVGLRPYAPAQLQARKPGDGSVALTWARRTRVNGDSWEGLDVPLGEDFERYRVEVLNAGGAAVARSSGDLSTPGFTYTDAMIAADFPGGLPNPLRWRVRQISAAWGDGPAATTATFF